MTDFWNKIFLDNSMQQWAVLVGGILLVLILNPLIGRLLSKICFNFFKRLAPHMGERFTQLVLRPLESLLVVVTISAILGFMNYPTALEQKIFDKELQIILAGALHLIIILNIAWLMLRMVDFVGEGFAYKASLTESAQDDQYVMFLRDVMKVVIFILVIFVVFGSVFDMNITSLLAGAGIAGLAVALAAQDSLSNLFGSLTIFSEKPFVMGDLVETNGISGTVEKVGFRSTRIRTLDKTFVTLPNKMIMESPMNNLSERTFRRVNYTVGLLYGTPIETIKTISSKIQQLLDQHEKTNEDGFSTFFNFGSSSLDIQVIYFIKEIEYAAYLRIREEISLKIMQIVLENGGDFAFPTTTVHLVKEPAADEAGIPFDDPAPADR